MSDEDGGREANYYKKVHTAESGEAGDDRRRAPFAPHGDYLLDAAPMEEPSAIKHDGCCQEEHGPLYARCVSIPHGLHKVDFGGVSGGDEAHANDTDDEGRDGDDQGEEETVEND